MFCYLKCTTDYMKFRFQYIKLEYAYYFMPIKLSQRLKAHILIIFI